MSSNPRTTVVLVPGLGGNARTWSHQVQALSDDCEVFVADYFGARSIEEMADRVLAWVPAACFSLVGFSLGGYVALRMATRAAERIDRLALISTSAHADTDKAIEQREVLIARASRDYESVLRDMGRFVVLAEGPNAEEARETLQRMGLELGAEEFCRQQRAAMQRSDFSSSLASIRGPVTVVCGQEDRVTPVSGNRYLAEHIPGATLEIIQGAGHLLPLERPFELNRLLRSWLEVPARHQASLVARGP